MGGETKGSSAWASTVTVLALAVSVFGNVLQYKSLQQKSVELRQKTIAPRLSQAEIDASQPERQRRQAIEEQLNACKSRLEDFDKRLQHWCAQNDSKAQ